MRLKQTPTQKYQALGRLKASEMNGTEKSFCAYLENLKIAGEILWYRFDAINLRLASGCFYKPDFFVLNSDGELIVYETKGFWTDDAKVKIKVAADNYPFRFIVVFKQTKREGGGWRFEEIK